MNNYITDLTLHFNSKILRLKFEFSPHLDDIQLFYFSRCGTSPHISNLTITKLNAMNTKMFILNC